MNFRCLRTMTVKTAAGMFFALALPVASASAESILFVGNSFTYGEPAGAQPVVQYYRPGTVTDLVGTGIGGVPSLFKAFTQQAGLNYDVSLETRGGSGLDFHYNTRLGLIDQPWDHVVLQSYSTLDASNPGDPAKLIQYSALLANALAAQNANVDLQLMATWSRALIEEGREWVAGGAEDALLAEAAALVDDATGGAEHFADVLSEVTEGLRVRSGVVDRPRRQDRKRRPPPRRFVRSAKLPDGGLAK